MGRQRERLEAAAGHQPQHNQTEIVVDERVVEREQTAHLEQRQVPGELGREMRVGVQRVEEHEVESRRLQQLRKVDRERVGADGGDRARELAFGEEGVRRRRDIERDHSRLLACDESSRRGEMRGREAA